MVRYIKRERKLKDVLNDKSPDIWWIIEQGKATAYELVAK